MTGLILFFKKARQKFRDAQPLWSGLFFVVCFFFGMFMLIQNEKNLLAARVSTDPFPPNTPVGIAKGIYPGRVVWVHDANATNENCNPDKKDDGYYLPKNTNQDAIDVMLSRALLQLTGQKAEKAAWDQIFRYFNNTHEKGNVGYQQDEKIFIKVNAVHACVRFDLEPGCELPTASSKHLRVETSPQIMLSVLRQLVYKAGVDETCITIADPMKNFHNHSFEILHGEFPDVHYLDQLGCPGREPAIPDSIPTMFYSDHGAVMGGAVSDCFYTAMTKADYLINIPALKGHSQGGCYVFCQKSFWIANSIQS